MFGKDVTMQLAVVAAGACPYIPAGSDAITTLWVPMQPHEYEFLSPGGFSKSRGFSCFSSSMAAAAARSIGKAATQPTVYAFLLSRARPTMTEDLDECRRGNATI